MPFSEFMISKSGLKTTSLTKFELLNLYWTRYCVTPVTGFQVNNIFEIAKAFTTTIISFDSPKLFVTFKLDGGSTGWFSRETLRAGKVILSFTLSIVSYLAERYVKALKFHQVT